MRALPAEVDVVVVGAGFSGLGMAVRLLERGRETFVVLERAADLGGTWRDNDYPGCACDVPSALYSFSFAQKTDWSRTFAPQKEILAYLHDTARRFGVHPFIHFGEGVTAAVFDDATGRYTVTTSTGAQVRCRHLVFGTGALSRPRVPALPGAEKLDRPAFHSAAWRHDLDLAGKRVAVVGAGASAIQFVPEIARTAGQVTVFQRTPPWILPKLDAEVSDLEKGVKRLVPGAAALARLLTWVSLEARAVAFVVDRRIMRFAEGMARAHLKKQVADREFRRRLTPTYTPGCKRLLLSNDWYPALQRDNVVVVDHGVASFDEGRVIDAAGGAHDVDVVIWATGFDVQHAFGALDVRGRNGLSLADAWKDGMRAWKGTHVAGFPNLSILMGPNTGLGHSSMVYMIEAQIRMVIAELALLDRKHGDVVDVTDEAMAAWNAQVQSRLRKTVWAAGCSSWYLDERGENGTTWPGFTFEFAFATRGADGTALRLSSPRLTTTTAAPLLPAPIPEPATRKPA